MTEQYNQNLWQFACDFYDYKDVKEQCLELQYVQGANVNILLWLCWLRTQTIPVSKSALSQALSIVGGSSQELIESLRKVREQLIASSNFTRVQEQLIQKHLLAAELAIEKIHLQRLQDLTARMEEEVGQPDALCVSDYLQELIADDWEAQSEFFEDRLQAFLLEQFEAAEEMM